jgi:hypothetical protein
MLHNASCIQNTTIRAQIFESLNAYDILRHDYYDILRHDYYDILRHDYYDILRHDYYTSVLYLNTSKQLHVFVSTSLSPLPGP